MKLVIKYLLKIQVLNTDFTYKTLLLIWLFNSIILGIFLKDSQGIMAREWGKNGGIVKVGIIFIVGSY
jgi:hypothetical protein